MIDLHKPGLVLFDMDSTLITIECIDEIAELAGCRYLVEQITAAAMRGELDFAASLRQRMQLLKGVAQADFQQLFEPIPWSQGAVELLTWFRQLGWKTAVVSGGFTWFAEQLQQQAPLDIVIANQLIWDGDRLTGDVAEPIIDAQAKAAAVTQLAQQFGIAMEQTIAVGDGSNDSLMLQQAALGIAYCAKPALQAVADVVINEPNLSAIKAHLTQQSTSN
ncbi:MULTISPECIES: phosphoserine phosphatase SerB [Pseudidiomarina]|uniref:Phosphoserine phosphatase n=2 Tax=Pseudidiomarina TaxID=2800384 RepID=A0A368UM57_9GAMM|nr:MULTISPECIES: phosphoserine phosphatase SerB [Pseudidiomarina]PWW09841.1 phosphoserine phosphatase [Pseudidiomarina maritima]RBP87769.1 phosphoserine phosphatase [Pseudidiomarina tainanensis]RCW29763.1 phosphoserine phosphatase [Pseudidiomarina tainanensis]